MLSETSRIAMRLDERRDPDVGINYGDEGHGVVLELPG